MKAKKLLVHLAIAFVLTFLFIGVMDTLVSTSHASYPGHVNFMIGFFSIWDLTAACFCGLFAWLGLEAFLRSPDKTLFRVAYEIMVSYVVNLLGLAFGCTAAEYFATYKTAKLFFFYSSPGLALALLPITWLLLASAKKLEPAATKNLGKSSM